ncbi:hypothetical protein [Microlunatus sp. Y2014]|uniref:hypothetical protein n=1 Tax=Microlunatus sp. Y2014 TaxID=3418488 RepID=UPI003DA6DE67
MLKSPSNSAPVRTDAQELLLPWRPVQLAVAATIGLIGLVLTVTLVRFTIDDAFITWRYGDTLINHGVWGWDPDAAPVEAYTNPIYAFGSIIPALLGIPAEPFFKLFSFTLLALFVVWVLRQRQVGRWQRLALLAVTLANPVFHIHLWSGLETPLFVIALTVVFTRLTVQRGLGPLGVALVVVLALTRPEGIGFAGLAMLWSFGVERSWRRFAAGVVTLVVLLVLALRSTQGLPRLRSLATLDLAPLTPTVFAAAAAAVALVLNRSSNLLMNYQNRFEWQLVIPVALVVLAVPPTRRYAPWQALAVAVTVAAMVSNTSRLDPQVVVLLLIAAIGAALLWTRRKVAAVLLTAISLIAATSWFTPGGVLGLATYRGRAR